MRLSRKKHSTSLSFNMTPMIDIVFLLIIFFMTVSQITRTVEIPIPLPRVNQGDEQAKSTSMTINLDEQGEIMIAGKMLTMAKALSAIEKKVSDSNNDYRKVKIQIRCHRDCKSKHVTRLFEKLAEMGFTNVRSAVSDL